MDREEEEEGMVGDVVEVVERADRYKITLVSSAGQNELLGSGLGHAILLLPGVLYTILSL